MRDSYYRSAMLWFGIVMTVIGVLGFVAQGVSSGNQLLGLFYVNTAFNVIYVATGVIGVAMAFSGDRVVRGYLRLISLVYLVWAVIGLFVGSGQVLSFIANNGWDVALSAVVAIVAAGLGWSEAPARARLNEPVGSTSSTESMAFGEYQDRYRR